MPYKNREAQSAHMKEWYRQHPDYLRNREKIRRKINLKYKETFNKRVSRYQSMTGYKLKLKVIEMLGGKCCVCGISDPRVLQVNHLKGGGGKDRAKYGYSSGYWSAIISGRRSTEDLDLRCANCNILYEYERGRRGRHLEEYLNRRKVNE